MWFSRQSWTSTWHLPGKSTVTVPWCSSRLHQGDALCSAPKMVNTSCDEKNAKRQGCWPTIPFSWQKNYFLATSQFFYLISQPKLFLLPVLKDSITSHYFHFGASRLLVYGSFWIITMPRLSTFFFPLLLDCHEPWDLSGLVKLIEYPKRSSHIGHMLPDPKRQVQWVPWQVVQKCVANFLRK